MFQKLTRYSPVLKQLIEQLYGHISKLDFARKIKLVCGVKLCVHVSIITGLKDPVNRQDFRGLPGPLRGLSATSSGTSVVAAAPL